MKMETVCLSETLVSMMKFTRLYYIEDQRKHNFTHVLVQPVTGDLFFISLFLKLRTVKCKLLSDF
jgi:hypothetical protein